MTEYQMTPHDTTRPRDDRAHPPRGHHHHVSPGQPIDPSVNNHDRATTPPRGHDRATTARRAVRAVTARRRFSRADQAKHDRATNDRATTPPRGRISPGHTTFSDVCARTPPFGGTPAGDRRPPTGQKDRTR